MRNILILILVLLSCPAWAAHPLLTDDPGTVAPGDIEFEQVFDFEESEGFCALSTTLTYGVTNNFDVGIGGGIDFEDDTDFIDPALLLKWRIIGNAEQGFSLALSSTTLLADQFFSSEQVSLLLGEYRTDNWAFLFNGGRTWINDEPDHFDWGLGFEYNTSPYNTIVAEATNHDFIGSIPGLKDELEYLAGIIYTDSRGYAYSVGLGFRPNDDQSHWRLTTGFTITL